MHLLFAWQSILAKVFVHFISTFYHFFLYILTKKGDVSYFSLTRDCTDPCSTIAALKYVHCIAKFDWCFDNNTQRRKSQVFHAFSHCFPYLTFLAVSPISLPDSHALMHLRRTPFVSKFTVLLDEKRTRGFDFAHRLHVSLQDAERELKILKYSRIYIKQQKRKSKNKKVHLFCYSK